MLSFFEYLQEGNKLYSNVEKPLSQGKNVSTVSAERYSRSKYWNKQADKSLQGDLSRLTKKGAIGGFKRTIGRYQDTEKAPGDVDKEKSYVVRQGSKVSPERHKRIVNAIGKRYGQQSTMHIKPNKEAEYSYMDDKNKVDKQGKVVYNRTLKGGGGDTSFAGKQSFTTQK
jgi:hypothetical protein